MRYEVRRLVVTDATQLRALRLRALATDPAAFGSTLERELAFPSSEWEDRLHPDANPHYGGFGLASQLLGLAVGIPDPEEAGCAELVGMWVDPEARGSGLAVALVDLVLDWAAAQARPRVRLLVPEGNERATALYRKLGFVPTGRRIVRERDGMAEIEMTREP